MPSTAWMYSVFGNMALLQQCCRLIRQKEVRLIYSIGMPKKCSLIHINTSKNITSNNITWSECAEFNHFITEDD